jgi:hypothetical protein
MKKEQTECSETSAYKIQTPGNCSEENLQIKSHSTENEAVIRKTKSYLEISSKWNLLALLRATLDDTRI